MYNCGMATKRQIRKKLVHFFKKYTLWWYLITTVLYFLAIPFTIFVFPATTLILTVIVLFGGFTSSVAAMASILTDQEQDEKLKETSSDTDKA